MKTSLFTIHRTFFVLAGLSACGESPGDSTPTSTCAVSVPSTRAQNLQIYSERADGGRMRPKGYVGRFPCQYADATRMRLQCGALRDSNPQDMNMGTLINTGFVLTFRRPFTADLVGMSLVAGRDFDVADYFQWDLTVPGGWARYDAPRPLAAPLTLTVTRASRGMNRQGMPIAEPVARAVGTLCGGRLAASFDLFFTHPDEQISPTE